AAPAAVRDPLLVRLVERVLDARIESKPRRDVDRACDVHEHERVELDTLLGCREDELVVELATGVVDADVEPGAPADELERVVERRDVARAAHLRAAVGLARIGVRVARRDIPARGRRCRDGELDAAPLAFSGQVLRGRQERRLVEYRDDLVLEIRTEVSHVDARAAEPVLDADIEARRSLGRKRRIADEAAREETEELE